MNARTHRIRLRRPWRRRPDGQRLSWSRRFRRPTGLGPGDKVWIVVERFPAAGSLLLNGRSLGRLAFGSAEVRFEVSDLLQLGNELLIELEAVFPPAAQPDTPPGEISLEIAAGP